MGSGRRRGLFGIACLCFLGLVAFMGSGAASATVACPNEAFHQGPSANLPDCRVYELVSPPEKEGFEPDNLLHNGGIPSPEASLDGDSAIWGVARGSFGDPAASLANGVYISRRSASGWSSESITPRSSATWLPASPAFPAFSEDLEKTVVRGPAEPPLAPGASLLTTNLYMRNNASGSYRLLSVGAPAESEFVEFKAQGLSADASHVVFLSPVELTGCGGAPAIQPYLCDWNAATGSLSLVGRLPDNSISSNAVRVAPDTSSEEEAPSWTRWTSTDGSRIFFRTTDPVKGKQEVYVRINGATTQEVSASQKTVEDPTPQAATFRVASADGSLAYFTSKEKLTDDATTGPADGGEDLYRYNVGSEELTDLTPLPAEAAENGARVRGVLGSSADGSRLYFVARGALAAGATAGEDNLYLWTDDGTPTGTIDFIATGTTAFSQNWSVALPTSRVTPDGMHLAFTATDSLTGYPNEGKSEVYLYSAASGSLACASCNPSGEPAVSPATIEGGTSSRTHRLSRNLSDDGAHLFFTTNEALVVKDTNNLRDIYQYEAASGAVTLISTGLDGVAPNASFQESYGSFADASADGNDVYFITRQQLVGIDRDDANDVYDARVNGGLASQNPAPPPPPCTGEGCRSGASSPDLADPTSTGFAGKGNVSQKQNCSKQGRKAKKLSNRAKRLHRHGKQAMRNGKSALAKKRNHKATRLAKRARNNSKSAKRCRKANRRASK